jgi:hypothetical protein
VLLGSASEGAAKIGWVDGGARFLEVAVDYVVVWEEGEGDGSSVVLWCWEGGYREGCRFLSVAG